MAGTQARKVAERATRPVSTAARRGALAARSAASKASGASGRASAKAARPKSVWRESDKPQGCRSKARGPEDRGKEVRVEIDGRTRQRREKRRQARSEKERGEEERNREAQALSQVSGIRYQVQVSGKTCRGGPGPRTRVLGATGPTRGSRAWDPRCGGFPA